MLKIKNDVDLKELKKYGFKILFTDEELKEKIKEDDMNYYCTMAYKSLGHHFHLVVENDEYHKQLTLVPENSFGLKLCADWQLDTLYDLIKSDLVEKVGK